MATVTIPNARIAGITCAVPRHAKGNDAFEGLLSPKELENVAKMTGVHARRVAEEGTCTSDLCAAAADSLLDELGWDRASVQVLVFVTQTPDYRLPATACVLQRRLGLSTECAAFDVNLGCSGYVYGLWMVASFLQQAPCTRALLLVGDTIPRLVSPLDRATAILFGDAGSATAVERGPGASEMVFALGTDGAGAGNLIVPAGGCRRPSTPSTRMRTLQPDGSSRSEEDLYMNGAEIFNFTIDRVPAMIQQVLQASSKTIEEIDYYVFHQANEFIIKHLIRKLGVNMERAPLSLGEFGNTSSASIPLTLVTQVGEHLRDRTATVIFAGFGVGYSWGAALLSIGPLTSMRLIEF